MRVTVDPEFVHREYTVRDVVQRDLALDIGQLILDITGILDPTPVSDGTNTLISLARGKWLDALTSAVSIVPYIGDLAKTTKIPKYVHTLKKAIRMAHADPKWGKALRNLLEKLKKVLDEGWELAGDKLPDTGRRQFKELKDTVDNFLMPRKSITSNTGGGGVVSSSVDKPTGVERRVVSTKRPENLDKKPKSEYGSKKDGDGPKTAPETKKPEIKIKSRKLNVPPIADAARATTS
jgi:hypothetical protein